LIVVSGTEPLVVMFFWNFAVFLSARRLEVVCPYKSHHSAYTNTHSQSDGYFTYGMPNNQQMFQ
jgi:hypothetical protein